MDILDLLLWGRHSSMPSVATPRGETVTLNMLEVALDRESREARTFAVLDSTAKPRSMALDDLRERPG